MFHVPMAPIHGHHSMSHGDYKPHRFLQISSQGVAVVEGTLMECEFLLLLKDCYTLFHWSMVSKEMFEIPYFMGGNPLHHNFKYGIFLLCSYLVHYMQVYTCVSGPYLDCSFLNLLMYSFFSLSHHQVTGIGPSSSPYSDPIQDELHSFSVQLWSKCESYQWLHPTMLGGI